MDTNVLIRKAAERDINAVAAIYSKIHTAEESGQAVIGWNRAIYPKRDTALAALERKDLFVLEENGIIVGTGIINQIQVDVYAKGNWRYEAKPSEVCVLHTLCIDPDRKGMGFGKRFLQFYEAYALEHGCPYLRIDTNEINMTARRMYRHLGYEEIGTIPCVFNGLDGVNLILMEKRLST